MKKISIFYYSGAGNTKYISKKLIASLKEKKQFQIIQNQRITKNLLDNDIDDSFDILFLGFPIYFRQAPELVAQFLKKLEGKKRKILFFSTKGLYSGNAIKEIINLSLEQDFSPINFIEFYMPGTDALILFSPKNSLREKFFKSFHSKNITKKLHKFIEKNIDSNKVIRIPSNKWYTFLDNLFIRKFEEYWTDSNKKFITEFHSDPDICIQCLKCVKGCPRSNITFKGSIQFGIECDTCFYCIHNCPVEAIQLGEFTKENVRYKGFKDD